MANEEISNSKHSDFGFLLAMVHKPLHRSASLAHVRREPRLKPSKLTLAKSLGSMLGTEVHIEVIIV